MRLSFFIAKKVAFSTQRSFSKLIINIAIVAIALSMAVMITATALVSGFKNEISNKVFGFWGHIHISHFDSNNSFEAIPIDKNQDFYPSLNELGRITYKEEVKLFGHKIMDRERKTGAGIRHIQVFANKAGIIKTKDQLEGIVLKGVDKNYDWDFLKDYLVEGEILHLSDSSMSKNILVSERTSKRLKLKLKDKFTVHFVESGVQKIRRFTVTGIYKTGLEEYDRKFALIDIRQIQKLNGWADHEVGGFEVFLEDIRDLDPFAEHVYYNALGPNLYSNTIKELYPNLFGWLELQDVNEVVILTLMILVSIINMTTALMILILERTTMIGILKALGATNRKIREVFLYYASYIIITGLFFGNIIGLGLCFIQYYGEVFKLQEESYYVSVAPIDLNVWTIIALNVGTLVITLIVLIIPSMLVSNVSPVKAIRFK